MIVDIGLVDDIDAHFDSLSNDFRIIILTIFT